MYTLVDDGTQLVHYSLPDAASVTRSSRSVAVMRSYFRFRMISRAAEFKTDCSACRLAALI